MFDVSLLNLPWATLVTLTSGYIGYFIANVGLKDHHKPIEVTFSSLIFGLTAMMAYQAVMWAGLNAWLATPPALLCAVTCGAWWRRYGRKWMYRLLWNNDVSWSDDTSSAWQAMFDQTGFSVTEVRVILRDGSGMMSRLPGNFEEWPNGPFTLGIKAIWFFTSRTAALQAVTNGKSIKAWLISTGELWQPIFQQIRLPEWRSGAFVQRTMNDVYFFPGAGAAGIVVLLAEEDDSPFLPESRSNVTMCLLLGFSE